MDSAALMATTAPIALDPEFMTEAGLAKTLGFEITTLRKWRRTRSGPPFVQVGRKFFYRRQAFLAWLAGRERSFEDDKPPRRRAARG